MSAKPQPKPKPEPKVTPAPEVHAEPATEATPEAGAVPEVGAVPEESEQDDLKRKYREAMARKHGTSGAAQKGHGDSGSAGPHSSGGPTQRMFRRKAGG